MELIKVKTHFRANSLEVGFTHYYRKEKKVKIQLAATSCGLESIKGKTRFRANSLEVGLEIHIYTNLHTNNINTCIFLIQHGATWY